jgi:ABC-type transport system involved in cytochrome bd biosynthesis fused ATPase/permease subunit
VLCYSAVLLCAHREQHFEKEIATIRKRELELQFKNSIIKTINLSMVFGTPPMTACVIFAAYEMVIGRLSATLAFTTLSLFNILRFPLVVLPKAMRALSEALASIERVEAFMLENVPTDAEGITKSNSAGVSIVSFALLCSFSVWQRRICRFCLHSA